MEAGGKPGSLYKKLQNKIVVEKFVNFFVWHNVCKWGNTDLYGKSTYMATQMGLDNSKMYELFWLLAFNLS